MSGKSIRRAGKVSGIMLLFFMITLLLSGGPEIVKAAGTITVTDSDGFEVEIEQPVEKIVCTSSAVNEILVALGAGDKIIARDEWSQVSAPLKDQEELPVVASSSFRLQIEAIAELEPDIVIADTMLQEDAREKLEDFAIPAIGERTSKADNLFSVIRRLAKIVDKKERGEELIDFISEYRDLIKERVSEINEEEKPRIYWEWREKYKSGNSSSTVQSRIDLVGGINIAADAEGKYPDLSSEFVIQENPEVIIRLESRGTSVKAMQKLWQEINTRTGLDQTAAVENERVYILTQAINTGLPSIVGDLYFAKIAHPKLFADIDPQEVYSELVNEFFGVTVEEPLYFPEVER
ncbi:MAG: ABC transporter substrate-binding protein [Halanaerobiaceae bacterium]